MRNKQRIAVVEDDEPVRASLEALLESWGFEVAAYADAPSFLAAATDNLDAACVLMDVHIPEMDGLAALEELRRRGNFTPVVMVTGHGNVETAVKALTAGASDFIEKPFDDDDLIARLRDAMRAVPANAERRRNRERFASLTPRETDVMREVVAGHSNKVIAHNLGLSPKTIEIHRARVMDKTGAESLSHLVRMAVKAGLDPEDEFRM